MGRGLLLLQTLQTLMIEGGGLDAHGTAVEGVTVLGKGLHEMR